MLAKELSTEVLVVGGGSAGIAASVASARSGAATILVEKYGFLGGVASSAEVGTICGLYLREDSEQPRFVDSGFSMEFAERVSQEVKKPPVKFADGLWFLPYDSLKLRFVCDRFLQEAGVKIQLHSVLCGVQCEADTIRSVTVLAGAERVSIRANYVIDCSGESVVSVLAGASMLESEPLQAAASVFHLSGVYQRPQELISMQLTKDILRGVQAQELPKEARRLSIVPGSLADGRMGLKLSLGIPAGVGSDDSASLEVHSRALIQQIVSFLSGKSEFFRGCSLTGIAAQVGLRTGLRPLGKAVLTRDDVMNCRKIARDEIDSRGMRACSAGKGSWPIEFWGESRKPLMEYFDPSDYYDIPQGCLVSNSIQNLLFSGRGISADSHALASARVIGTCLQTGYSAGLMASSESEILGLGKQAGHARDARSSIR